MALLDQRHTARLPLPDDIVQGQTHVISCPVYLDGALVAPDAGDTVSVYDSSGTAKVDAQAITVSGSIATYSISGATSAAWTRGVGWRVEWTLTLGSDVHVFGNDAAVVRRDLYPVISDVDLVRRVPALDTASSTKITSSSNYQDYLDESWTELILRVREQGHRPSLVMSPNALRECHLYLALSLLFEDLETRENQAYSERSRMYRDQFEAAWRRLAFVYDDDDDGIGDSTTKRRAAASSVWLNGG